MSLLLLHSQKSGLVQTGLVAYYDFKKRNLLQYSEEFDNTIWGATSVLPDQAISPRGDLTADEISDELTTTAILFLQSVPTDSSLLTYTFSVFVKKDNDETRFPEFRIKLAGGASQPTTAGHLNTKTGQFALRTGAGSMSVTDEGDYWRVSVNQADNDTGNSEVRCSILPAYTDVLGGAQDSTLTGTITAWGAQLNQGSSALAYEQTTNNQTLLDISGKANHGELGSTPGADTNDPHWANHQLIFGGIDDYASTPDAVTANANALTMQVVFRKTTASASASDRALLGHDALGSFARFESDTTIDFTVTGSTTEQSVVGPGGAIADDGLWKMMTFRWNSGVVQDQILNADDRIVFDDLNPASGTHDRTFKLIGTFNSTNFFDGEIASVLCYRRFLTDPEVARNYQVIKSIEANRGISLP